MHTKVHTSKRIIMHTTVACHTVLRDTARSMTVSKTRHRRRWATIWTVTTWWCRGWIKRTVWWRPYSDNRWLPVTPPPPGCALQRICRPLGGRTILPMTFSDISIVLSVQLTRCRYLLLACWYLQVRGALKATCPVLEWHTSVSQVRVFECYNLVAYTNHHI